jgi:hypothetical protein
MPHSRIVEKEQPGWRIVEVAYFMFWISSRRVTKIKKKSKR